MITLDSDGIIHEVANGLMHIAECGRSALAMIPVDSGNDYARMLGTSAKVDEAVAQLLSARVHVVDAGYCNGEFFLEALSFGLD